MLIVRQMEVKSYVDKYKAIQTKGQKSQIQIYSDVIRAVTNQEIELEAVLHNTMKQMTFSAKA